MLQWLTCTIRQILYLKAPPQLELCLNDPVSAWECRQKAHLRAHIHTPTLYLPLASPFYMQSSNDCDATTVCATDKIHFDSDEERTSFYRLLHSSRYWVQDIQTSRAKTPRWMTARSPEYQSAVAVGEKLNTQTCVLAGVRVFFPPYSLLNEILYQLPNHVATSLLSLCFELQRQKNWFQISSAASRTPCMLSTGTWDHQEKQASQLIMKASESRLCSRIVPLLVILLRVCCNFF